MPEFDNTPTNIKAVVTLLNNIQDCFFTLDSGINWSPGWAVGAIDLPLAVHCNRYVLTRDSAGTTYWVAANHVKYRGEIDQFNYHYFQNIFNWNKHLKFDPINEGYIPSAGKVWDLDRLSIAKDFEF